MILNKFTLEQIMLIKSCNTKDKDKVIQVLRGYIKDVNDVDPVMAEIIDNTINKLKEMQSQKEFLEAADYPL